MQEWQDKVRAADKKARKSVEIAEDGPLPERGGAGRTPLVRVTDEECRLFFTSPSQLLQLFSELEEQNLSLIQNSQETEELLEDLRQTHKETGHTLNTQIHNLKRQVDLLMRAIELEEEKGSDLEMNSKLLSYGEYRADDQEQMLAEMNKKVASVYAKCIGPNEANISSLNMLTAIEGCLEQLFETIETLPADKVEAAEKLKDKERRMRLRAEKMAEQRLYQELKLRRMQERATGGPAKTRGRKVMYRSEPPVMKKKQTTSKAEKEKEEEEMLYFFT
ncbi:Cilia- and flagella-associated protein 100 [Geodia barretti]|uniref:Cilia- and flagella-associated protein 100 n=1 Tax=Geodia barretti TaxID=519541 RepID=A0AA35SXQ3_GEOBA|nr:Cilia- and flagella-associated protein 100 [Geodia barretti]